jgi:hypothetical protein
MTFLAMGAAWGSPQTLESAWYVSYPVRRLFSLYIPNFDDTTWVTTYSVTTGVVDDRPKSSTSITSPKRRKTLESWQRHFLARLGEGGCECECGCEGKCEGGGVVREQGRARHPYAHPNGQRKLSCRGNLLKHSAHTMCRSSHDNSYIMDIGWHSRHIGHVVSNIVKTQVTVTFVTLTFDGLSPTPRFLTIELPEPTVDSIYLTIPQTPVTVSDESCSGMK